MALTPLPPLDVRPHFRPLGVALLELLRGLDDKTWLAPTVCSRWQVRDIAAHLLDTACRRLSGARDGHVPPPPSNPITNRAELVAFLDGLNATWVEASQRLSPRVLIELLETIEAQHAAWCEGCDLEGPALWEVAWAGLDADRAWLDLARELTERWLHQQQIRLAVGAPPLNDPEIDGAVFDTFARAWPAALASVDEVGARVVVSIAGAASRLYTLRRGEQAWEILTGLDPEAEACVGLDAETAWLALTKGITPLEAERRAIIDGRRDLARVLLRAVAVMA